jgi:chromosome segregation ATPase
MIRKIFLLLFKLVCCSNWLGLDEELSKHCGMHDRFCRFRDNTFLERLRAKIKIYENQEKELSKKSEEINILKEDIASKASLLSIYYHEVRKKNVEIDLLKKDLLSSNEKIKGLNIESVSKNIIINQLHSEVEKMNRDVDQKKALLSSKSEYITRIESDLKKMELEIEQTKKEIVKKENHEIKDLKQVMKELLFKLENINKMEFELEIRDLEIGRIKNCNTNLIQELSLSKEIIHKQEIKLTEQFEIVDDLNRHLSENQIIIEKKDMQCIKFNEEVNKEIEELRAEIVKINENQKLLIDAKTSQFNHDLQVKQLEIEGLKSLIKSGQKKIRLPVSDNSTKFWT